MIVFPNAKINLGLQITGRRKDGYHEIITCMYPVPWLEAVEIQPAKGKTMFTATGIPVPGNPEENLILKAYKLLQKEHQLPEVHVHLHKKIPMGAGLGGGSADAAFTLKALDEMFHLFLGEDILEIIASETGSDCAFFIKNIPALATGRGEILEPLALNLSGYYLAIVHPGIQIGTKEAYSGVTPKLPEADLKEVLTSMPPEHWRDKVVNDFEEGIFKKHPIIAAIKKDLYAQGAIFSSMSGSGAAVFGLFNQEISLREFKAKGYTCWQGQLS